jgi:hypothetical protein
VEKCSGAAGAEGERVMPRKKTSKQIEAEIAEILARGKHYAGWIDPRKITYGKYMVYATPADFEKETTTLAGARRAAASLHRLGFKPIIKRHATDGKRMWNEVIEDAYRNALVRR